MIFRKKFLSTPGWQLWQTWKQFFGLKLQYFCLKVERGLKPCPKLKYCATFQIFFRSKSSKATLVTISTTLANVSAGIEKKVTQNLEKKNSKLFSFEKGFSLISSSGHNFSVSATWMKKSFVSVPKISLFIQKTWKFQQFLSKNVAL